MQELASSRWFLMQRLSWQAWQKRGPGRLVCEKCCCACVVQANCACVTVSHLLVQRLPDAQFHLFCRLLFGLDLSVNHDLQFLSVHFVPPHVSVLLP